MAWSGGTTSTRVQGHDREDSCDADWRHPRWQPVPPPAGRRRRNGPGPANPGPALRNRWSPRAAPVRNTRPGGRRGGRRVANRSPEARPGIVGGDRGGGTPAGEPDLLGEGAPPPPPPASKEPLEPVPGHKPEQDVAA